MALSPTIQLEIGTDEQDIETSNTYNLDLTTGRIIGYVDGKDALNQAIDKILLTERFDYLIYPQNYGTELKEILKNNFTHEFIESELERVITEALMEDERIISLKEFSFKFNGSDSVYVEFTVDSVFGIETVGQTIGGVN